MAFTPLNPKGRRGVLLFPLLEPLPLQFLYLCTYHTYTSVAPCQVHALFSIRLGELARQVAEEVAHLGEALNLTSFCVYGGIPVETQLRHLRREKQRAKAFSEEHTRLLGNKLDVGRSGRAFTPGELKSTGGGRLDVLIATPGRLIDLMGLGDDADDTQTEVT